MRSIDWDDGAVRLIDQTALPERAVWLRLSTVDDLVSAIVRLAVRGAPSLGAAGALGVALAAHTGEELAAAAAKLRAARPTAVNLARGVDRALRRAIDAGATGPDAAGAALAEARAVIEEEAVSSRTIGTRGADLLVGALGERPMRLLTHCNTGWLACVEWGTALGIVATLHGRGLVERVYAGETRPLLQGARLTAYELSALGAPYRIVVDSAGPSLLSRGLVDAVLVGADRIAANGDVANKIGTYPLALAAARVGAPFVVAAPESTVDAATATGADIPIEERDPREVSVTFPAENPAFDVTPHDLVTAIVTDVRTVDPRREALW
ncbi:MAG: S-methyl-5-thioribose-1-phosphate isomerase [Actinobacteria bacterium]|nr:S-methyl-5-thioribose-1-phosphate isomerase [Actinomycetota bacterium]MBI3686522.1 S-methyl-5-thioribose-1-phosphate isomerase [Actinomycetota bacterium]